jgi:hypothetical protein
MIDGTFYVVVGFHDVIGGAIWLGLFRTNELIKAGAWIGEGTYAC